MDAFCVRTLGLLQLEKQAEEEESLESLKTCTHKELQDKGVCLLKLRGESRMGFYGRQMMLFKRYMNQPLPPHKLSHGEIVGIFDTERPIHGGKPWMEGVVNKVSPDAVEIIFDSEIPGDLENKVVNICIVSNDVTMKRYRKALDSLEKADTPLTRVCFESVIPQFVPEDRLDVSFKSPASELLNAPQQEAVRRALRAKDLFIIHGPPGTGKTTTCVSFLLECAARNQRVLVCAPSNAAVDNLLIKVIEAGCKNVVRLGHPARVSSLLQQYTLDARVERTDEAALCKDVRGELKAHFATLNNKKIKPKEKFATRNEVRLLQKELRQREKRAKDEILCKSQMVMSTCAGATNAKGEFDVVLIDECAQALEVACWIPLQMGRKGVLAGDHQQLSATVKSTQAQQEGLNITLFQRMHEQYGDAVAQLLSIQYRMNSVIMGWSSAQFYESKLEAAASVKDHTLNDLPPLLFLDTAGQSGYKEEEAAQQVSKMNMGEAKLVVHYVKMLRQENPKCEICCISPYSRQVETIRTMFLEEPDTSLALAGIPVNSVDSFQGQESDAVIISLVRANEQQEIGFLSDTRRLNVAVTRARKHCVIIGDSSTISSNAVLGSLYEYAFDKGQVRFAEEYMELETAAGIQVALDACTSVERVPLPPKAAREHRAQASEPPRMNDSEMEKRRAAFKKRLETGLQAGLTVVDFPKGLNACERMIVHEVATSMNLAHESRGEGKKRFVSVRLKEDGANMAVSSTAGNTSTENMDGVCTTGNAALTSTENVKGACTAGNALLTTENGVSNVFPYHVRKVAGIASSTEVDVRKASSTEVDVRKVLDTEVPLVSETSSGNKLLASLAAERRQRAQAQDAEAKNLDQVYKQQKKAAKNKRKQTAPVEEDFDSILQEFTQSDQKCSFLSCQQSVALIPESMRRCRFCSKQYCQEHVMAEVHGCGDAVRSYERANFKKVLTTEMNTAKSSFGNSDWKRKQAKEKLHSKIMEKTTDRTKKPDQ